MGGEDLPLSLRKKLIELQKKAVVEKAYQSRESVGEVKSPIEIVYSVLEDSKAREVLEHAKSQYPEAIDYIVQIIAELVKKGKIKSLDGVSLYNLLHALGVRVRLPTKIKFVKKGREVDIKEYFED